MMDLPGLQQEAQDFLAMAKRPIVWYALSSTRKQLVVALQRMVTSDTDSMGKLLVIFNSLPAQEAHAMDVKMMMAHAGVPDEHHESICGTLGDGTYIAAIIAWAQLHGVDVLVALQMVMAVWSQLPPDATFVQKFTLILQTLAAILKPVPVVPAK